MSGLPIFSLRAYTRADSRTAWRPRDRATPRNSAAIGDKPGALPRLEFTGCVTKESVPRRVKRNYCNTGNKPRESFAYGDIFHPTRIRRGAESVETICLISFSVLRDLLHRRVTIPNYSRAH